MSPVPPSLEDQAGPISGDASLLNNQEFVPSRQEDQQLRLLGLPLFPQTGIAEGPSLSLEVEQEAGLLHETAGETARDLGPSWKASCWGEGAGGSGPK